MKNGRAKTKTAETKEMKPAQINKNIPRHIFGQTQTAPKKNSRPKIITAAYFLCHFLQRKYWQALVLFSSGAVSNFIFRAEAKTATTKGKWPGNRN